VISYVLPWRCEDCEPGRHVELAGYLAWLVRICDVTVVDGSPAGVFARHRSELPPSVHHIPVDPGVRRLNGKVGGVLTGVRSARSDTVVIADEDVRYDEEGLRRVARLLGTADVVIPQNVFSPMPWHARWDTGRTLLNRAFGHDYPGTLGVRRSALLLGGGYDGDVLFENLELIRTVRAHGGRVVSAPDVFVARRPPSGPTFFEQRVRQAYDDLAQPVRLATELAILPVLGYAAARRWVGWIAAILAGVVAIAEVGRRRHHGARRFPPTSALFAPAWLLERAICVWIAVASRWVRGGCAYRGRIIRRAATPMRRLRRRANRAPSVLPAPAEHGATRLRDSRRRVASSVTSRIDRGARSHA
jgi:Glycosyltransferase like family 2